jgi:hypothetical protein
VDPLTRLAYQAHAGDKRALEAFVQTSYDQVWRLCAAVARAMASLALPAKVMGRLIATGEALEPYRLLSPDGEVVRAVSAFFADLRAAGRSEADDRHDVLGRPHEEVAQHVPFLWH